MRVWRKPIIRGGPTEPPCAPSAHGAPGETSLPLPGSGSGSGSDVAAFLASERGRGLTPETLKLRRAAICTVPPAAPSQPTMSRSRKRHPVSAGKRPDRGRRSARRSRQPPVSCARSWPLSQAICAGYGTARFF
jgi:hypothetical protein